MLSDQTDWLDIIDRQAGLFRHFDTIFNSFRLHKSKRDASVFKDVCAALGVQTGEVPFVDDNIDHIKRAQGQGLQTIHFVGIGEYKQQIRNLIDVVKLLISFYSLKGSQKTPSLVSSGR
jgi:putative hydrolase of the HAD superfamily